MAFFLSALFSNLIFAAPHASQQPMYAVELGPRPYYLLDNMDPGPTRDVLQSCANNIAFQVSDFAIGHRGAALQFPEETSQSIMVRHFDGLQVSRDADKSLVRPVLVWAPGSSNATLPLPATRSSSVVTRSVISIRQRTFYLDRT